MRLYVGSLHFNITEEMLRGIFEPFGRIQSIQLILDQVILFNIFKIVIFGILPNPRQGELQEFHHCYCFQETGRSKGYGFITYYEAEDAKKALEQMNGFELAGRPIKVGHVTEKINDPTMPNLGNGNLDYEELDR